MESKLTAQLVIVLFIALTAVGVLLRYVIAIDFSLTVFFQYILLLCFLLIILGRPLIKIALDLIRGPYRRNEDHFPLPGAQLTPDDQSPKP